MHSFVQDIRFAFRQLRQSRGFAALAITTLAFGIGANTAMFTIVDSVVVRALPYLNTDRIIYIGPAGKDGFGHTSWLNYRDIRDQATKLDTVGCYSEDIGVVQGKDGSISVAAPGVTPNIFKLLGVNPLLGRTFTPEEGEAGGPEAAILSEQLWREAFQADPQILGQTIRINGQRHTVVGVMPKHFRFPDSVGADIGKAVWLPLKPTTEMSTERGFNLFSIVGSLRHGVTLSQEQSEVDTISARIAASDTKVGKNLSFRVANYQEMVTGTIRPVFFALGLSLALVLLIACTNVANLLIARCLARQHEFAIRAAIGANRSRLAGQLIAEGATLSILGSALGSSLAWLVVTTVHKLPPDTIPRADEIAVHWTTVLILAAIVTLTTILSASIPALLVARSDPQATLQMASRGIGTRSIRGRLSGFLVAGEVAVSVVLLIATGLLFRTLWNLEHAKLGFETSRVFSFSAMPADAAGFAKGMVSSGEAPSSPVAVLTYQRILERVRSIPGVQNAALATAPPLSGVDLGTDFSIVGRPEDPAQKTSALVTAVSGDYPGALHTPVVRGRMISDNDGVDAPYVVVINETLARSYFQGIDPIGQQLEFGKQRGMPKAYTIVGVTGDQIDSSPSQKPRALLMIPYQQIPTSSVYYPILVQTVMNFVVATRSDIALAPSVRAAFKETAPEYALDNFRTMREIVDGSNFNQRLGLWLIAAFASMAVLMVIAGLYGVLTQLTGYRRREFGIRLALGATPAGIRWMVLRQGLLFVVIGLTTGLALAAVAGRFLKSFIYGVTPSDPATLVVVVLILLLVGSTTGIIPAKRTAAMDPMNTLREE